MKNNNMDPNKKVQDVLDQYVSQTAANEDVHFSHADWIYSDSSDCCC